MSGMLITSCNIWLSGYLATFLEINYLCCHTFLFEFLDLLVGDMLRGHEVLGAHIARATSRNGILGDCLCTVILNAFLFSFKWVVFPECPVVNSNVLVGNVSFHNFYLCMLHIIILVLISKPINSGDFRSKGLIY